MTVADTFTRTDAASLGNADTGQTWILRPWLPYDVAGVDTAQATSVMGTNGSHAYSTDAAHGQQATIDHGTGNTTVYVDLDISGIAPGTGAGVVFRWQDDLHFWNAMIYRSTSGGNPYFLFATKQDGAGFAGRTYAVSIGYNPPVSANRLKVVMNGSAIDVTGEWFSGGGGVGTLPTITDSAFQSARNHGPHTYYTANSIIDTYNGDTVERSGDLVGMVGG